MAYTFNTMRKQSPPGTNLRQFKQIAKLFAIALLVLTLIVSILYVFLDSISSDPRPISDPINSRRRSDIGYLGQKLEAYFAEHKGRYPETLEELVTSNYLSALPVPKINQDSETPHLCETS